MNLLPIGMLILCCLPTFGFALRGIALLTMRRYKPGRIISASGVVAMISMWLFVGLTPRLAYHLVQIYNEFDIKLPGVTLLTLIVLDLPLSMGVFWYPFAFAFGLGALVVPEVLFYRRQSK